MSNAGRNKILRIHINWKFQLGNLCKENLENVESFLHLGSRRQGRAVCDADQLDDAEQNDAFTTSAYHSWRV